MTQEEKVRAYDKALKRAKAAIDIAADKDLVRGVVRTILPELAESEDERIRKELVAFFKEMRDTWHEIYWHDLQVEGILAWLEKQKEQKPDSLIYDKDLDKAAREFYLSGGAASPVDSTGLVPIVRMAEFGATWMKERMEKEQKPCWNPTEEDVALFNKAITTNASLSPQERAKLDILRMKFKHRPVIEQKEQKSAEWSKEDENMLWNIISIVGESKSIQADEMLDWLKSLSPSWKPNVDDADEQPEADLEKEIQKYLEKLGGGHGGFVDDLIDDDLMGFAHHFYELGKLNARKED